MKRFSSKLLEKFSQVKILVVGDVMIDRYCWGSVERISPEAPVPVVRLKNTSLHAGGAANVAANIAGLGAEPILIGITGDDAEAGLLPEILGELNISTGHILKISGRQTTIKTRILAHNQQVVRMDQETDEPLNSSETAQIWENLEKILEQVQIIVVSDYAKGFLTEELLARLITSAREKGKFVLIDPKGKNYAKYSKANLLTPNKREAAEACKLDESQKNLVEKAGTELIEEFDLEAILITQGAEGMTLFQKGESSKHFSALARKVYDVTGAGDTVIATLAVALGAGSNLPDASALANIAAGLVVEQVGTTAIKLKNLSRALSANQKI